MEKEYKMLRNKYLPSKIKIVFVLESPPAGGGYFYNPNGKTSEILFRSLMNCLFGDKYIAKTKAEGLQKFKESGYLLVDPIYQPINKLSDKQKKDLILKNYNNFLQDLHSLKINKNTKIILIKKNICLLLEEKLKRDGFNVLNKGLIIPFPMHYYIKKFNNQLRELLQL